MLFGPAMVWQCPEIPLGLTIGSILPTATVPQTIRQKASTEPKVRLSTIARKAPWKFLMSTAYDRPHTARRASLGSRREGQGKEGRYFLFFHLIRKELVL